MALVFNGNFNTGGALADIQDPLGLILNLPNIAVSVGPTPQAATFSGGKVQGLTNRVSGVQLDMGTQAADIVDEAMYFGANQDKNVWAEAIGPFDVSGGYTLFCAFIRNELTNGSLVSLGDQTMRLRLVGDNGAANERIYFDAKGTTDGFDEMEPNDPLQWAIMSASGTTARTWSSTRNGVNIATCSDISSAGARSFHLGFGHNSITHNARNQLTNGSIIEAGLLTTALTEDNVDPLIDAMNFLTGR